MAKKTGNKDLYLLKIFERTIVDSIATDANGTIWIEDTMANRMTKIPSRSFRQANCLFYAFRTADPVGY
jgi:hypothetical protein